MTSPDGSEDHPDDDSILWRLYNDTIFNYVSDDDILRAFAEAAGCTVAWDGKTKKITLTQAGGLGAVVEFTVGKSEYKVKASSMGNYVKKSMDTAPLICEDRTYIPLRYAAEALGYKVNWNAGSRTATCSESGFGF